LTGFLETFALVVVLKLFNSIEAKEIENLRWIRSVGDSKNKRNASSTFQVPEVLKKCDSTKRVFEDRINQQ
jgi:hypothetical protein